MKNNVVICPPCGESVAVATKEGQNKKYALWPLLPRLTAVLPPQGREMNGGFTLIELLVVVLIIGILAAVALPQYKVAVAKSKVGVILPLMKSLTQAENTYFLAHGEYANDPRNLDIDLPADCTMMDNNTQRWTCDDFFVAVNARHSISASYCPGYSADRSACMEHRDLVIRFPFFYSDEGNDTTEYLCTSFSNLGKAVCASLGLTAKEG